MAEGWFKITPTQGAALCNCMFRSFRNDVAQDYIAMAVHCWASIINNGKPVPYFRCGKSELARCCLDARTNSAKIERARRFLAFCEDPKNGFFVRVGDDERGKVPKRTFWCLLPEGNNLGVSGLEGGVSGFGSNPTHPNAYAQIDPTHPKRVCPDRPNTHTETETQSKTTASGLVEGPDASLLMLEHYRHVAEEGYRIPRPEWMEDE